MGEVMDLFLGVTLPIIITLMGIIITMIITHLRERRKLDKIEDIAKDVDELKKVLGDRLKWTLEDFSGKVDNVLRGLMDVVKHLSKSNPHSLEKPKSSVDESVKQEND